MSNDVKLIVDGDQVKATAAAIDMKLGDWMWVKDGDGEVLACVTRLGSNYIGLSRPARSGERLARARLHPLVAPNWRRTSSVLTQQITILGQVIQKARCVVFELQ